MDFSSKLNIALGTISEAVYGNMATIFHRTHDVKNISGLFKSGYKQGSRALYGPGLYGCFDMKSQFRQDMYQNYGPYLIKFGVPLDKFLILDYDIGRRVYGTDYSIVDKAKEYGLTIDPGYHDELKDLVNGPGADATGSYALGMYKKYPDLPKKINGILFTGSQDGRVAVVYNASTAKMISWMKTTESGPGSPTSSDIASDYAKARSHKNWHSSIDGEDFINAPDREAKRKEFDDTRKKVRSNETIKADMRRQEKEEKEREESRRRRKTEQEAEQKYQEFIRREAEREAKMRAASNSTGNNILSYD